eukprot:GFYU01007427.1.p1 GENE.GFYU01007427.1~~GFYU01007427.1.p1  ORF type:complete len:482 (+),score=105.09 GFYU01007427.1:233-1678(+)
MAPREHRAQSALSAASVGSLNADVFEELDDGIGKQSINCVLTTVFLSQVGFAIVLPSLSPYLEELGQDTRFLGYVVAAYNAAAFVMAPIFGWWSGRRPMREIFLTALTLELLGWIIYAVFANAYTILVARIVIGMSAGIIAVSQSYIAMATTDEERTAAMSKFGASSVLGFVLGGGIGGLCNYIDVWIPGLGLHVHQYNAPGYLSIVFVVTNVLQVVWSFEEIPGRFDDFEGAAAVGAHRVDSPVDLTEDGDVKDTTDVETEVASWQTVMFIFIYLFFVLMSQWTVFETIHTPFVLKNFGWPLEVVGIVWAASALVVFVTNVVLGFISQYLDDDRILAIGWSFCVTGFFCMGDYGSDYTSLPQYVIGFYCIVTGFGLVESTSVSAYSKILPADVNEGYYIGWYNAGGSLAQMLGPIWASQMYHQVSPNSVWLTTGGLCVTALAVVVLGRRTVFQYLDTEMSSPIGGAAEVSLQTPLLNESR